MSPRKKILLVDDSYTMLVLERVALGQETYEYDMARDGQEAVEKVTRQLPDLILMDVIMPRMNGFEALRALRARIESQRVPIIMVTTCGEENNVKTGMDAGATDYVTKPIDPKTLQSKVRSYLGE